MLFRSGIVPEEFMYVVRVVGGGHHVDSTAQKIESNRCLRRRSRNHGYLGQVVAEVGIGESNRVRQRAKFGDRTVIGVEYRQVRARSRELSRHARSDGSEADDAGGLHERGRESSRQPPRSGGTPPRPRRRMAPARMPASDNAVRARLNVFTVGLTGVEPVTSSLSGMRSNRLSYSPAVRARA